MTHCYQEIGNVIHFQLDSGETSHCVPHQRYLNYVYERKTLVRSFLGEEGVVYPQGTQSLLLDTDHVLQLEDVSVSSLINDFLSLNQDFKKQVFHTFEKDPVKLVGCMMDRKYTMHHSEMVSMKSTIPR